MHTKKKMCVQFNFQSKVLIFKRKNNIPQLKGKWSQFERIILKF